MTGLLPTEVLRDCTPEQPDSVGREGSTGMRRIDDAAHAGDCNCEAVEVEIEWGEPMCTAVRCRSLGRGGTDDRVPAVN